MKIDAKFQIVDQNAAKIVDLLQEKTGLSKSAIKSAMEKGACWIGKSERKLSRVRISSKIPNKGDWLALNYDSAILDIVPPVAHLIDDQISYSVWNKPAGLLTQGSEYGDFCSLERQVELHFAKRRSVFVVHRLDRETSGIVLLCHNKQSAAKFSKLFADNTIEKLYRAEIVGNIAATLGKSGKIEKAIEGKASVTRYEVESYDEQSNISHVQIKIDTGRTHQIRKHFSEVGHPVMGDPLYGSGNKNRDGLKLSAFSLSFKCPLTHKQRVFKVD